jgi:HK97 gp10 family phage protein
MAGKKRNVDRDSYYWRFVEFGTSKMSARPFMRPAFDGNKLEALNRIKEYLTARIDKEAAKL